MIWKWLAELLDEVSDLYTYWNSTQFQRTMRRLDRTEYLIKKLRRDLINKEYARWCMKNQV